MNKMKLLIAFVLIYTMMLDLNAMENKREGTDALSYEEFKRLESESLKFITRSYGNFIQRNAYCSWKCHEAIKKHRICVAQLALRTDMPNLKKLDYVIGDDLWKDRKKIITALIEEEQHHPDAINDFFITPLRQSVTYNDKSFTKYLLQKGATVTPEVLEKAFSREMLSLLQGAKGYE